MLRVESGRGYNLNVSLFERLIHTNFPHVTLTTQHRMHPDISELIKPTYPELLNGPKVSLHPDVIGVPPGARVIFLSHNKLENNATATLDEANTSYANDFEAEMITRLAVYFQQQGYKNDQIVILTPYLGQLRLIASMMKEANISSRDLAELRKIDPKDDPFLQGKSKPKKKSTESEKPKQIRVSSIDNYQVCSF